MIIIVVVIIIIVVVIIVIVVVIIVILKDLGRGRVDDIDGLAESSTAESGEYE